MIEGFMIDVSELAAVPVLSGAPEEDLVRVARTAADIRLGPQRFQSCYLLARIVCVETPARQEQ